MSLNATLAYVRRAVHKQFPMKPLADDFGILCICPVCKCQLIIGTNYCCECGQKIDYSESSFSEEWGE